MSTTTTNLEVTVDTAKIGLRLLLWSQKLRGNAVSPAETISRRPSTRSIITVLPPCPKSGWEIASQPKECAVCTPGY